LNLLPHLLQLYEDDPDPGIHGAAEWLLRQWEGADELKKIDKSLATGKVEGERQWYVNQQGQTMTVVSNPGEFWMGGAGSEGGHLRKIGRSFAIASKEVTVEQFLRFRKNHPLHAFYAPEVDCPVNNVSWCEVAEYCNWLNEQEGIPKEQWCYLPNEAGKFEAGMKMAPDFLGRTGYRLPTEAEWEYACSAGAETKFAFGEAATLVGEYGWVYGKSEGKSHPVGRLRPNDLGLFDMYGNAWEWTQGVFQAPVKPLGGKARPDTEDNSAITPTKARMLRGGGFQTTASGGSNTRTCIDPTIRVIDCVGFRPARTIR